MLTNPAFAVRYAQKNPHASRQEPAAFAVNGRIFCRCLLERDRLGICLGSSAAIGVLLNEAKGRVEAKVVSASALGIGDGASSCATRLRGMSGKDVILQQETDPSLLGGLLIELREKFTTAAFAPSWKR